MHAREFGRLRHVAARVLEQLTQVVRGCRMRDLREGHGTHTCLAFTVKQPGFGTPVNVTTNCGLSWLVMTTLCVAGGVTTGGGVTGGGTVVVGNSATVMLLSGCQAASVALTTESAGVSVLNALQPWLPPTIERTSVLGPTAVNTICGGAQPSRLLGNGGPTRVQV